jgi:hypothetical protein
MVIRPNVDARSCFVLTPFRDPFNQYYRTLLKPTMKLVNLDCVRADEIHGPQVMEDIWKSIWRANLVIADVTQKNPNVNYELGICHALGVPTIIITQHKKHVPFDYLHHRYILYQPGNRGWRQKLKNDLIDSVKAALDDSPSRETILVWPAGAKIGHRLLRRAKLTLPLKRSALLDFPKVPFKGGQNADFIRQKLPPEATGFILNITMPEQVYWRCGFALSPEDYIHEGLTDIEITQYFLFHLGEGKATTPTTPPQKTSLACQVYRATHSLRRMALESTSPVELRVKFGTRRRGLSICLRDQLLIETAMEPSHFRYLYILAWADYYPPVRVPVDLELLGRS